MRVFPDLEVGEEAKCGADLGEAVVAGEGNGGVISHAMHIQHHVSRVCLDQDAFEESDHAREPRRERRVAQALPFVLWLFWLVWVPGLEAREDEWRIWLEPQFMRPAASGSVKGAERTLLAGGLWDGSELRAFSKMEWASLGVDWEQFERKARAQSTQDLARMEIRLDRDKRQVIRFAELRCREPLVASAVLAPGFVERFAEILGESVYVAVPSRYQAFVFPKLVGDPRQYAHLVLKGYRDTIYPVSLELFETFYGGLRAIGLFQEP